MLIQKFFADQSKIFLFLSIVLLLNSCSFKSVSGVAANQLSERGAFVGEAPEWTRRTNLNQSRFPGQTQGYSGSLGGGPRNSLSRNVFERERKTEETFKKSKPKLKPKEASPLDRILELCPRVEEPLNQALVTTEVAARIKLYADRQSIQSKA